MKCLPLLLLGTVFLGLMGCDFVAGKAAEEERREALERVRASEQKKRENEKREHEKWAHPERAQATPTPKRVAEVPPAKVPERAITLREAVGQGLLRVKVQGKSLTQVQLEIEGLAMEALQVTIPAGTCFLSGSESVQSMVCTKTVVVNVWERGRAHVSAAAACVNMNRAIPREQNGLTLAWEHERLAAELGRLMALPEWTKTEARTQQYAVWTLTDNPIPRGYAQIVSGFAPVPMSGEPVELDASIQTAIRELFTKAEIPLEKYRLFNRNWPNTPPPTPLRSSRRTPIPTTGQAMPPPTPATPAPTPTATPVPTPPPPVPRYILRAPIIVRSRYGQVTLPAGTEVTVSDFGPKSVRVKARGEEYEVAPDLIVPLAR